MCYSRLSFCISFLLFAITTQMVGQSSDPIYDPSIKAKLDSLEIKYTISDKGNFRIVFNMGKERTQLVVVNSAKYEYGGLQIREITSTAAITQERSTISRDTLFLLLEKNQTYKLGAWQINGGTSPFVFEFGLRINANSSAAILEEMMMLAAKVADEMEQSLSGGDKY